MKAEELMIGDWVYQAPFEYAPKPYTGHGWKPVRVTSVPFDVSYFIEPIPLSVEILKKNGFERRRGVLNKYIWSESNCCKVSIVFYDLELGGVREKWNVANIEFYQKRYYGRCDYVHQLQHALRLCGINKEIEL